MILVSSKSVKGAIRFRFHSFGADIIAVPRGKRVKWFEVRRREVKPGAFQEYHVALMGDDMRRAMTALVVAGYANDNRDARVAAALQEHANGSE